MSERPTPGRVVHYVSYGTPGGEYPSKCRAALVTDEGDGSTISIAVLNPTGLFFDTAIRHDEDSKAGGTWHWPERV